MKMNTFETWLKIESKKKYGGFKNKISLLVAY